MIVLLFYSLTVNPTIAGGDNPEVTTGAVQLGTVHPPGMMLKLCVTLGYPLITMIGYIVSRAFSFVNNPAIVLNLLSVLFAGVSVYFLCGAVYYLTNGDWASSIFSSCITSSFLLYSAYFVRIDVMDSIRPIRGIHDE